MRFLSRFFKEPEKRKELTPYDLEVITIEDKEAGWGVTGPRYVVEPEAAHYGLIYGQDKEISE